MIKEHCVDTNRYIRQGFPEAVYAPGKNIKQIIEIIKKLLKSNGPVIVTRVEKNIAKKIKKNFKKAKFYPLARLIVMNEVRQNIKQTKKYICVVTAGTSDIPVAEESAITAQTMGSKVIRLYDVGVAGVHRLLNQSEILRKASCVIVCAGMEGALASVVGGLVSCPVIGVPTSIGYGVSFGGVSALLTMLNSCAANVSVVNIDDGFGAGVIAHLVVKNKR